MNETTSQRTARLLSMSNAQLIMHAQDLTIQRDELLASERKLSDAYIRLREKLSAFDTPAAPTAEQVYEHTEAKLDRLLDQRDELLAALDDVKIYLQDTRAQRHIYDRVIKAITSVKGGAA